MVKETNDEGKEEVVYKIDIGANRYDLLCLEGIVRALLVFQVEHGSNITACTREILLCNILYWYFDFSMVDGFKLALAIILSTNHRYTSQK